MIWDWVNLYHMYLFRLILQANPLFCFIYLLFSQVSSRQVDVPAEFIRSILCSNDIVKIMLQHIYPLFRLDSGIRVASMSSVDSIPSPNVVLILRCEY